jgi:hypothetical protein
MGRGFSRAQLFLVLLICFSLSTFSVYFRCSDLSEADFLQADLRFGNAEQEGLSGDYDHEMRIFSIELFSTILPLEISHFKQLPILSGQPSVRGERTAILRC